MDSEADRAQSVLRAIPQMSREIVDDTLYEKVFSFLKGFVESGNTQLLDSLGVFDILIQACEEEDQDYRVINLCYRILGTVVEQSEKDNVCIFDKLQYQHGSLLDRLLSDITNPQPAVRCAVLEALRSCLTCGHAAQWLLEREEIAKDISSLCTDGSTYIVDQFCQLYSLVLKLSPTSITYQKLLAALNPSNEIKSVLRSETSSPTTVHALDFCYSVANIQTSEAWRYMLDENLLQPLLPLLCRQDRIANDRILEILTVIFNWTPDPLLLLLEEPNAPTESSLDNAVQRAYHYIIEFSDTMMRQATHISTVQVAVSLLETSVELLKRLKTLPTEELYNALRGLLLLGTSLEVDPQKAVNTNILRLLNRAASARKLFLHDVLRALQTLFKTFSLTQAIPQLSEDIMATLNIRNLSSDKKVLQPALELFGILLDQFSAVETTYYTQSQLSKCVDILVDMLSDYSMKSQNVALVLKFIGSLLSNDKLSSFMLDPMTSGSLINTLELMIMNPEWDARDDAISFVGSLFDKPSLGAPIAFALSHDLPLQVMDLIQDPDTFVRASALEMLEKMMRVPEGWVYIQRHQRARDIARKLPSLLYDPESYVRRAALGSISCLIVNRSCEGMIIEKHPLHEKESLNKELVDELMGDPDSEVRLRVCRMLLDLWNLHLHTKEQQKRSRSDAEKSDEYQPFFYLLEGDKRLMEATEDTHRLVRKEAIHAIQTILQERHDDEDAKVAQKRKHGDEMDTDEELLRKFADLNLTALEESTQPEHLYAEALDVSSAMMTAQAPVTSEDNDGNQLDCYN